MDQVERRTERILPSQLPGRALGNVGSCAQVGQQRKLPLLESAPEPQLLTDNCQIITTCCQHGGLPVVEIWRLHVN